MTRRLVLRAGSTVLLLWLVATLSFFVISIAPGSYADQLENPRLGPEARELVRRHYGLDRPVYSQYLHWLGALARGTLGTSFHFKRPVSALLAEALPPTLILAGSALLLDFILGVVLALGAVRRPGGLLDRIISVLSLGVYGMPTFWLAAMLVLLFSVHLRWLPPSHMFSVGAHDWTLSRQLLDFLRHLVLPAGCLGLVGAAATARYLRASLLEVRNARFIQAARARGLSARRILWVHSLRPALLPVVTTIGLSFPVLVSGSVVVEVIFSWPGMGRLLLEAAHARDIPVLMAVTMVGAAGVILGNLVADLLYAVVDPRAREPR